ncbi:MAG: bifunctional glutamate N-acetyltransferase/amino-acid acetyltransferase ArgJ [Candidatus Omnitrophica bacterium]|nr:bifunctional glutamate N-acetyltransferase/amino-acid acetyltransferase ArgJ [Candidatus Omnitrophota bacterium]
MITVKGGVASAKGFMASGVKAGIKFSGRKDLALLYSEVPAVAAGAFTTNRCKASPVKISMTHLGGKTHQAIIVNSGNANCANGKTGKKDALAMASSTAKMLDLDKRMVLVASTGIIGVKLPVGKIVKALPELALGLSEKNSSIFAETIMTTDTKKKEFVVKVKLGNSVVTIGGACKGVGMLYPEMKTAKHATMLAFIATDVSISKKMLEESLEEAISNSFNMVSADGDMSTNDSCFIMANGLAGNKRITNKDKGYKKFTEALKYMAGELAKMLAADGEGATKFVEIEVKGAKTVDDARKVARKVSTSNLLKCAIFGTDPNWGRVVASAGASGVEFDIDKMDIYLGPVKALSNGAICKTFEKEKARKYFKDKKVYITIDLKSGKAGAKAWTCDFSKEYVAINSEYST